MKKILALITIVLCLSLSATAQVAINEDGSTANASAMLDIKSANKGVLLPRMTEAQILAIANPAAGLIVFNTDNNRFYLYNDGSSDWQEMALGTGTITPIPTVLNPTTGKIWMDRNLGAAQVATSSTDAAAYGDLYQWGRLADGHENRSSGTTTILSSSDVPGHNNMIVLNNSPFDWRNPQNGSLWQGVGGINNPCPGGFRLPTQVEWEAERTSWVSNDAAGAFGSPLKLIMAGWRHHFTASLSNVGTGARYWSGTVNGTGSDALGFDTGTAFVSGGVRAYGFSVRCIKD